MRINSGSAADTKKIAADLAKRVLKSRPGSHARVVALSGDLGAGKTTFTQGFAKTLGIKHRIVSPTFLIFRNYPILGGSTSYRGLTSIGYKNFYHVDVYRIQNPKELDILDFKHILKDPHNIVLIEWADKIKKILPKDTIWVNFTHGRKETERFITYRR